MLDTLSFGSPLETVCRGPRSDRALLYSLQYLGLYRIFHIRCLHTDTKNTQSVSSTRHNALSCANLISRAYSNAAVWPIIEYIRRTRDKRHLLECLNANLSDKVTKSVAVLYLNSMKIAHANCYSLKNSFKLILLLFAYFKLLHSPTVGFPS